MNVDETTVLLMNFENRSDLTYSDTSSLRSTATARNGAVNIGGFSANAANLPAFSLRFRSDALDALDLTATALENLSTSRSKIGVAISRLKASGNVLSALRNVTEEAAARISNADIAEEAATSSRAQILQQVAASVLKQVNLQPQLALQLLGR